MTPLIAEHPFTCVTCAAEIAGAPVVHVGLPFCCPDCVAAELSRRDGSDEHPDHA